MNKKKKIVIRAVFIVVMISLIFFFFKKGYEYCDEVLNFGKNYFGIFFIPVVFIVFLDIFFTFLDSRKKRILYKTRLFFMIIFLISVSSLFIGFLKYYEKMSESALIELCLMKYKMGFLMTYLGVHLFDTYKFNYVIIFFSVMVFISLFFLTGKEIIGFIKYVRRCQKRREALKMKKALLEQMQTQIAIKETLETQKADEYQKQNIILETVIKEKVDEAIEKDKLPVKIVIENLAEEKETEEKKEEVQK